MTTVVVIAILIWLYLAAKGTWGTPFWQVPQGTRLTGNNNTVNILTGAQSYTPPTMKL